MRAMLASLSPGRYDPAGPYVGPRSAILEPPTVRGSGGARLVDYPPSGYTRLGVRPNPTVTAQYGLLAYDRWLRHHRTTDRRDVVRVADWLLRNQRRTGSWLYNFDWSLPGASVRAPWTSAMAQGQAMSLLERAYRLTGRRAYLEAAERAVLPLTARPGRTRLVACFDGCGHPFFEEYPSVPRSDVLNGFMFTLVGLYDLASVAPHSPALALYRAGRRTLNEALPRYDKGGLARYSLASDNVAAQRYQAIHVYLLRALDSLHTDPLLVFYANRWLAHLGSAPA